MFNRYPDFSQPPTPVFGHLPHHAGSKLRAMEDDKEQKQDDIEQVMHEMETKATALKSQVRKLDRWAVDLV